jgi:hypothetical protein
VILKEIINIENENNQVFISKVFKHIKEEEYFQ